ncbi:hypothetical protein CONPUDRAFT_154956 [Coniophora puteana RWD-64-598 SS2]|uniref:Peptidase M20 domain-containing protein 2 n=1 Tax=Coniophora puteana (strain RWD-64-598) TaxID=741705 RepID=A0A5M3MKL0_CONPW|nr:uncharacterized protein CONPUDRAFT_154956 [Coniophora puteana RWD-64-598 SS2]EIW79557.1 hypothetical protein CONPUDRAFT_154956 [Coniophora puteana RWD-64-598 SS2]
MDVLWRPEHDHNVRPALEQGDIYRPDVLEAIEAKIDGMNQELRDLSLNIHSHPETLYKEVHAHDTYTAFMRARGFAVADFPDMPTAWCATFSHGSGGPVLGVNSEMDALPGIGHACGHNLIGIAGVAVACAVKAAMEKFDISGEVVLLGTPAEEDCSGKVKLLEIGAYKDMDACLMCHPAPGPLHSISLSSSFALVRYIVEYSGHSAHAALSPWEGQNALDAAVLAYTNISVLRQQLKPTNRVHGIFSGQNWAPNIIPDNARMEWIVRAKTTADARSTAKRVVACFEAAATATGCEVKITEVASAHELRQNATLAEELRNVVRRRYGEIDYEWGIHSASTDFGHVTYAMPALHPGFSIPSVPDGGNHTPGFTAAAATEVAHDATLVVSKALAAVGARVLTDEGFLMKAKASFEEDKKARGAPL